LKVVTALTKRLYRRTLRITTGRLF